jgi:hypothetical protein
MRKTLSGVLWCFDVVWVYRAVSFKLTMGRPMAYHKTVFFSHKGYETHQSGGEGRIQRRS